MHRDPCPGGVGRADRGAQRFEVVCRRRRLRYRAVRTPLREVADDLHPGRPGRHLRPDRRNELVWRDRGVHARKVPFRRGEEPPGGGDDRTPGYRSAREAEADLAAAPCIADHRDPGGRVFLQARGAVLAVREIGAALVNRDGRMRVRVDKPSEREPARQFLLVARAGNHPFAEKTVQEHP